MSEKDNSDSSDAARELSKLGAAKGGDARAQKLTPERRREIAQVAIEARWRKAGKEVKKVVQATHGSPDRPLKIGNIEIPCYVLEDGRRVLAQKGMVTALGMTPGGSSHGQDRIVKFATQNRLNPYTSEKLKSGTLTPIEFRSTDGRRMLGYEATLLADLCDAVLEARRHRGLTQKQQHVAMQCEILVRGFARVGIIALVDEATGYQDSRAKDELIRILDAYISEELRPWTRMFPEEFFKQSYRLLNWEYKAGVAKRNSNIGKWINKYIYEKLPPGVLPELRRLNPRTDSGYRRHKHFQFLTAETGNAHLDKQITSVVTIMKVSDDREDFERNFQKVFPKKGDQARLPLVSDVEPEKKNS